ncbi:aminotransferase class V-fold PLP-dependent enzyme [Psychroserpens sp.]|uniref:aminotransferase class V-fold PLP-dependent enzyme n=1 Tax=Psychroserpens sp. TaxID=2020870 RepID=UPI001B1574B0|nr:aminotransferase class V-fold PLP-dependent enzyme [Psychroserpens sp.]MBO6607418.1 aminotransferase class V-fold PLP-dependent enzyme [Psychroserpens sp.]MBO6654504.1 aminotransferase class V-fold PLP-dependent enzyme [Psychroserpens sp.]MBO6681147.1 aminotransferase class V-fold PLP-dependent enzyme [Psychroserpens sp.]MBO6749896.1 aminotransferase class V-fold PLP-dependent enzyme [Psychroserpens sp.]MBO6916116.1 aminotransferase class V-fold PLP-dependent enzyme [Psychroserpens sp.]
MISTEVNKSTSSDLEQYFSQFRSNIIGIDQEFETPFGTQKIIYTDWTASGRLYRPIEEKLCNEFGPFVANTHTETTVSGTAMTKAYHEAKHIIKSHVNSNEDDVLIVSGNGMTGVVNKFQRILGLKVPENLRKYIDVPEEIKPVVFVTHMEHHSNQTSWLETIAKVEVIPPDKDGLFSLENLETLLEQYKDCTLKIASVIGGSNVTGIQTPYHQIAELMHKHGGVCFVDFACSAPYVNIDMHPENELQYLDAIFFSPHKFLGGPGTSGVLIFNKKLYKNMIPDCPGGGTVSWTNPWGEHKYIDDIEDREDGGTPGFLQTIKTALAIKLKEQMGVSNILDREHQLISKVFKELGPVNNINILAGQHQDRLGVISFYIDDLHYNLGVKLLNDRFGIQTRGGCSCAGTYGHFLLHVDQQMSHELTNEISIGDLVRKPGWIRMSIHPTTTDEEMAFVCESIKALAEHHTEWAKDYEYQCKTNEFIHKSLLSESKQKDEVIDAWFKL